MCHIWVFLILLKLHMNFLMDTYKMHPNCWQVIYRWVMSLCYVFYNELCPFVMFSTGVWVMSLCYVFYDELCPFVMFSTGVWKSYVQFIQQSSLVPSTFWLNSYNNQTLVMYRWCPCVCLSANILIFDTISRKA